MDLGLLTCYEQFQCPLHVFHYSKFYIKLIIQHFALNVYILSKYEKTAVNNYEAYKYFGNKKYNIWANGFCIYNVCLWCKICK